MLIYLLITSISPWDIQFLSYFATADIICTIMKSLLFYEDNIFKRMFKASWCLFALAFLTITIASDVSADLANDPELRAIVNNYFGCKTWEDGVCTECSEHYYFN